MSASGAGMPPPPPPAAGPTAARDLNTTRVLSILRARGPLTQAELVRHSGLARPTVAAIVRELSSRGVVVDAGVDGSATNGRPGSLLAFDPRCATVAVTRVTRAGVDVLIADGDGSELGRRHGSNPGDAASCLRRITELITELQAEYRVPRPSTVAMLIVGRVDPATGVCTSAAFGGVPVRVDSMEDQLSAPVTLLNPTAAAAVGVARAGRYADALVVFLDHGIGAGLVCGGQVLRGATGGSGELGHCRLPNVTRACRCGRRGCLETVASGWFISQRVTEILGSRHEVPLTLSGLERLGDQRVDDVLADAARQLGLATSWLVNTLNPRAVLLGGTPFAAGSERFLTTFAAVVLDNALPVNREGLLIDFASERADLDGAVQAALDRLDVSAARR